MLDDFRKQAGSTPFLLEEEEADEGNAEAPPQPRQLLGMTPQQRLIIAVLILITICLLGTFVLVVTDKLVF